MSREKEIKLIAIDLDGTLLTDEKTISQTNKEAIQAAKDRGIKVVLTTGRPYTAMTHYLEECNLLEPGDYCITYNGGLIQKTDTEEILRQNTLSHEDVQAIHQLLTDLGMPMSAVGEHTIYEPAHPEGRPSLYREIQPLLAVEEGADPQSLKDISKIVSARTPEEVERALAAIPEGYHHKYTIVRSMQHLFEFMPKGVHKASGLQMLADELDISPNQMMAIGDMQNDATMLQYVGIGVAMGNADDEIKEMAQFVTKSNNDHGVAHAIETFVLN